MNKSILNTRIDLPKPCVDTGMGLERITALNEWTVMIIILLIYLQILSMLLKKLIKD